MQTRNEFLADKRIKQFVEAYFPGVTVGAFYGYFEDGAVTVIEEPGPEEFGAPEPPEGEGFVPPDNPDGGNQDDGAPAPPPKGKSRG